ncbi:MAG TPA: hypothetical protein PLD25_06860 [Chloroflexota bacterium]|nr:hypothetical protein [Chloroflexota bacterium]
MFDEFGNRYPVGGFIADHRVSPLVLFEARFARHDDGEFTTSVYCAHSAIRRRYHSIRSSIAVLAGSWSKSSVAMMESHDITLFFIPFEFICDLLEGYGVDFRWGEKEQEKAFIAWEKYNLLSADEKAQIGRNMIQVIQDRLTTRVAQILDESVERTIEKVVIELVSNLGEVKLFEFTSVEEAIDFLEQEELENYFVADDSLTLFDPPPQYD